MLANRNLRLLTVGQFISAIGDQFYLIALPWLALELTGSALIAGSLLAVAAVPRAACMLLGGALTDRFSARTLLVLSNGLQGVLMGAFAVAVLLSFTQLWLLYLAAFASGLLDAFGLPAFSAVLPRIVPPAELEGGNVYVQGANMASAAIGPALAGLLIARTAGQTGSPLNGLAFAFLVNSLTFLLGILFFSRMQVAGTAQLAGDVDERLVDSIGRVVRHIRQDAQLSSLALLMLVIGFFLSGTIRVGFPMLAEGVRSFGDMTSAFGAGLLAGMIGLKLLPKPPQAVSGLTALALFAITPCGLILLGLLAPSAGTLAIILVMGGAFGYVTNQLLSWVQRRTPQALLGRMMAVFLFATIGLSPLSQVLMGYLLDWDIRATLIGVGSAILLLLLAVASRRSLWALEG
jgi:MFS family permease